MRRGQSLRTRVALAAALGATIIVAVTFAVMYKAIARSNLEQVDRRLTTASRLVLLDPSNVVAFVAANRGAGEVSVTVRHSGEPTSSDIELPQLADGRATVEVGGRPYRLLTVSRPRLDDVVTLGLPLKEVTIQTNKQRQRVLAAGIAAIAAAAGLGWALGGRALRPIARLTSWVHSHPQTGPPPKSGVREADELSDALATMNKRSASSLETARDFAAAAAHELRTPLTAMRTNVDVLRTMDLDRAAREEVLADLDRTQARIESTLRALEQLAVGDLASPASRVEADLAELCDRAAHDAARAMPDLAVELDVDPELVVLGFPAGLRLVVDNALTNARRHGNATRAIVSAHRQPTGRVVLAIDDDGTGIPRGDRQRVFERFVRGTGAAPGGSGLGLALIAQQAALHGGRAWIEDSSLGGARLVVELAG
ncbi:sensor histidine kinase [Smaragdicoccus niigatensis]|uniref:sensor histidine kinase n=1 Tax=Smaragdicoccus niigatensis TaxID=359359 RepID=UPI00037F51E0|nr:HAMP domain-containing sensor histidine kinase [Smaragdicoccus niigatensis]